MKINLICHRYKTYGLHAETEFASVVGGLPAAL